MAAVFGPKFGETISKTSQAVKKWSELLTTFPATVNPKTQLLQRCLDAKDLDAGSGGERDKTGDSNEIGESVECLLFICTATEWLPGSPFVR